MSKTNTKNSQQELLPCCFCDHVSPKIKRLWLLLCYLRVPFQLASRPGFHVTHMPKGNLVLLCINKFFWHFGIVFSPGRGSFLVLSATWHAGSPPGHHGASFSLPEARGTCSGGSKWHVPAGSDSEHVEPPRLIPTHVKVKRLSDG